VYHGPQYITRSPEIHTIDACPNKKRKTPHKIMEPIDMLVDVLPLARGFGWMLIPKVITC
jgi:hypothetical protein